MIPLTAMMLSVAALAGGERPRAAERRAARLHNQARSERARCLGHSEAGSEERSACLTDFLQHWEDASVRARGTTWPAHVPGVTEARHELKELLLERESAVLQERAAAEWASLATDIQSGGESSVTAVREFIERWQHTLAVAGSGRRTVRIPEVQQALNCLPDIIQQARRVSIPAGPWSPRTTQPQSTPRSPTLRERSAKKNGVIDDARWFREVGWTLPIVWSRADSRVRRLPSLRGEDAKDIPEFLAGDPLRFTIIQNEYRISLYGAGPVQSKVAVYGREDAELKQWFDFDGWTRAPEAQPRSESLVGQSVVWAEISDNILYVSNSHQTYARASMGHNGYLSAIDLSSGTVLWRSDPLVCNSRNFVVLPTVVVCGYGFTGENDYLYVVDRATGSTLERYRVKTGPDYLFLQGQKLFVRTYDMDYRFDVQ